MRWHGLVVAGLSILVTESAARSYARLPEIPADPAAGAGVISGPAPVMRTLRRACFDCHSDQTRWPWYSALPVASWVLETDVREGRGQLNFSRWRQYNAFDRADLLDKACALAKTREMPLWPYAVVHREARLSGADTATLCAWTRLEAARLVGEKP